MQTKNLLNRQALKSKIVLNNLTAQDMCAMLSMSENSYYNKLNGKRDFTESELCVIYNFFGKTVFFPNSCYEKRKRKEV
jgi:hypothetical protein